MIDLNNDGKTFGQVGPHRAPALRSHPLWTAQGDADFFRRSGICAEVDGHKPMNTFPPPPPPPLPLSGPVETGGATPFVQLSPPPLPPRDGSRGPQQDVPAASARFEGRDARGRFTVGNSGRPKGARSRLITELEQAMELGAPEIVRILIARAHDGSMEAAKYIVERIAPSRRGRLVEIEGFPEIRTPADVPAALASLATAVGNGVITIEEGTTPAVCFKRS